jgi:metallo-beta-lactamase class B
MKKSLFMAVFIVCASVSALAREGLHRIEVADDIEVVQISQHCYVHVSYTTLPPYGRIGSNGVLFVVDHEALLFDTPMNDSLTEQLVRWIEDSLCVRIAGFVPNHWHDDCIGGLGYLNRVGIPSYASGKTIAAAKANGMPVPQKGFADSLVLSLGGETVRCKFLGAGHAHDNIVTWFPSDSVLFPGCMVKEANSLSLGNLSDADLSEWPKTIARVIDSYPGARAVVPGHGAWGGVELLRHTQELLAGKK